MKAEELLTSTTTVQQTPQRRRRLLPYLSMGILAVLSLGLALLLGASTPTRGSRQEAAEPSTPAPQEDGAPASLLRLATADIPLLKTLQERQQRLVKREQWLTQREKQLQQQMRHFEERLTKLATLRKEIEALLQEKEAFEEKRFEHLVKVYEGMKPQEAASLLQRLQEDTAVRLLYRMREKKAGQILSFVKPEIAAKLSERLAVLSQKTAPRSSSP